MISSSLSPIPTISPEHGDRPAVLGLFDGRDAVLVGVGAADLGVAGLAGVQVVVVGVDAGRLQLIGLAVAEDPEAGADLDLRVLILQFVDKLRDALDVAGARAAATGNHADP